MEKRPKFLPQPEYKGKALGFKVYVDPMQPTWTVTMQALPLYGNGEWVDIINIGLTNPEPFS